MIGSVIQEETSMETKMGKLNMFIYLSIYLIGLTIVHTHEKE